MAQAKSDYKIMGSSGVKQSNGILSEEWHRNLQGDRGVKVYREMGDQDPAIGAVLSLLRYYTKQTDIWAEPSDPNDQAAVEQADFISECLADMSHTFADLLDAYMTASQYGWAFLEIVYKLRMGDTGKSETHSRYSDGKIGWRKIELRPQSSLSRWQFDEDGNCSGMWQEQETGQPVFIPIEKAILFRPGGNKRSPEGFSMLRPAYLPWYYRKRIQELEAIGIENDATGIPVLSVPPDLLDSNNPNYSADLITRLEKKVVQIRNSERRGLVIPAKIYQGTETGWNLELLKSGGNKTTNASEVITRYRTEIVTAIFQAGFMYLGTAPNGSRSLHSSQTDTFALAIGALLDEFCETFTRFGTDRLMKLNGVHVDLWPTLQHGDIETPPLSEIGDFLSKVAGAGLIAPTPEMEEKILALADMPTAPDVDDMSGEAASPQQLSEGDADQ